MNKQILLFGIFMLFFVFAAQASNIQSENRIDGEIKSYIVVVDALEYPQIKSVFLNSNTEPRGAGVKSLESNNQNIKGYSILNQIKTKPNQRIKQLDIIHGFAAKMTEREASDLRRAGYKVYADRILKIIQVNARDAGAQTSATIKLQNSTGQVGANDSWVMGYTGNGTRIAIIDTGVDYTHPDLGNCTNATFNASTGNWSNCSKVVGGYNYENNNTDPMDDHGHGTHCAGIAAANGSIKGVAPDTKLLAYKVCDSGGSCNESNIILGIQQAITDNAKVISMSLGYNEVGIDGEIDDSNPLEEAIRNATANNITVVIAAGNEGLGTGSINIASISEDAISVGAVDKLDNLAGFTSIGPAPNGISKPDLVAPGVDINSTCLGGGYCTMSGTSMATPHVAGAVAILKQAHPEWTVNQTRQALMFSAKDTNYWPIAQGSGRINISAAINNTIWTDKNYLNFTVFAGETTQTDITITNNGTEQLNLSFWYRLLRGDCVTANTAYCNDSIFVNETINLSNTTIANNSVQTINISVSLPSNTTPGTYSGILYLNAQNTSLIYNISNAPNSSVFPMTITVPAQPKVCVEGDRNISFKSYVDNDTYPHHPGFETGDILHYPFFVEASGTNITILTNWTNSAKDINLHLKFPNGSYYNQSLSATTNMPENATITNASAGWYDIIINYWDGSDGENVTTTISLRNENYCNCQCYCANCSECEEKLNSSLCQIVYLTNNTTATETCINNPANFNNKTFDCQGHTIIGEGAGFGITLENKTNNTIMNCIISNFSIGIFLQNSSNNFLINNTAYSNLFDGVHLTNSSNNNVLTNNTANSNLAGIELSYSSDNNTLTNNTANQNNQSGINLDNSSNNTLENNTANSNNQTGIYLVDSSSNNLTFNTFCSNMWDINNTETSNTNNGTNNTCCFAQNYNDTSMIGCAFFCSGGCTPPHNITIADISGKPDNSWSNISAPTINFSAYQDENMTMNCTGYANNTLCGYNDSFNSTNATIACNLTAGDGNYTIFVNCSTSSGLNNVSNNWTYKLDATPPTISFDNSTPTNGTKQNKTFIEGNATASDNLNLSTIIIYLYNESGLINSIICNTSSISPCVFNFTDLTNGTYYLNATANDSAGNENKTETRTIYIWSTCVDNDDDDFFVNDSATCPIGDDCNDNNASINPNVNETYDDNIDENCDGIAEKCGDGVCDSSKESCSSCSADCGSCSVTNNNNGGGGGGGAVAGTNGTGGVTYNLTYLTELCAGKNIIIKFPYSDFGVFLDGNKMGYTNRDGTITFTTAEGNHSLWFIHIGNRQEYNISVNDCSKPYCGNKKCDGDENCLTCSADCEECARPSTHNQILRLTTLPQNLTEGQPFDVFITNNENQPLENVTVTYGNQTKTTDKNGKISFIAVKSDQKITASKDNYTSADLLLNITVAPVPMPSCCFFNIGCNLQFILCWYWWLLFAIALGIAITTWKILIKLQDKRHIEQIFKEIEKEKADAKLAQSAKKTKKEKENIWLKTKLTQKVEKIEKERYLSKKRKTKAKKIKRKNHLKKGRNSARNKI